MGQSYRIRTTPGQDKNIQVQIDQDFEQLEILSLKIRQQDVYTRMCSDYGVIAGRVFANNGYGIPNARVSIFIPLLPEDEENPVITAIYPYKNLEQRNEDGYVYNLLPYEPSYSEHVPTGTFPTRTDALTNKTVVELYDKYYKFTVSTNDAGDFLIFGIPTGTQTLVLNVDLSDIGPFSLSPQDLVRMGIANEEQFDGVRFKASSNFNELPQIVTINKTVEILPFWGQPELCQIGINRVDFDLTGEANIDIKPTAIFMGSLMSSNEKSGVKQNGRAQKATGELCRMITGPGEIIGITQTIYQDSDGLPVLERANLPNGGHLIDGDGTWLFDIPMNLDYVYTNEFGDLVLSEDPNVGVPTKGKYRFKIKWQQSKNLNEDYKRGYYLVPNIKEKGWDSANGNTDPLSGLLGATAFYEAQSSYAFSLSWSAYTINPVSVTNPDILSIINCEDYFYEFDYNKVYTVSQFIDLDKRRSNRERFIGIKRIDEDTCSDTTNKYPVNDGVFHTTLSWVINNIIITVIGFLLFPILIAYSIAAFLINLIYRIISQILCKLCSICFGWPFDWCPFDWICDAIGLPCDNKDPLGPITLPMINYPDCEACDCDCDDCDEENGAVTVPPTPIPFSGQRDQTRFFPNYNYQGRFIPGVYQPLWNGAGANVPSIFPGFQSTDSDPLIQIVSGSNFRPTHYLFPNLTYSSNDLPLPERINMFNNKAKYFNDYEGLNQISVKYNPSNSSNTNSHLDNIIAVIIPIPTGSNLAIYSASSVFSFTNLNTSTDKNITGSTKNKYGTFNTTGTTVYPQTITVNYADPTNKLNNLQTTYTLPNNFTDVKVYAFPSDIEYFQVITAMTVSDFINKSKSTPKNGSLADILKGKVYVRKTDSITNTTILSVANITDCMIGQYVVLMQRGVDQYSPVYNTQIGLGKIFGFDNHSDVTITSDYRLNIPIQTINTSLGGASGDNICFENDLAINNSTPNNGQHMFFPSYIFTPGNYVQYTTNKTRFYSRLDDKIAIPSPPVFVSNPLINYVNIGNNNGVTDLTSKVNNGFYLGQGGINNDGKIFYFNTTQSNTLGTNRSTSTGLIAQTIPGYYIGGSLINGRKYRIVQFNSGDNFTSGGASSNSNGVTFVYNGGPITWTHLSKISEYVTVGSYTTSTGSPNQTSIPANNWNLNFISSSNDSYVHFEVYKKDLSNVETFIFQSNEVHITSSLAENMLSQLAPSTTLLPTDRIVVKFVAINIDSTSHPITISTDNNPQTYLLTSFNRDDAKYIPNESLVGGSYMFMDASGNVSRFSPVYPPITTTMSDPTRIVMRGDRLPSTETVNNSGDNSPLLENNNDANVYSVSNGIAQTTGTLGSSVPMYNSDIDPAYTADTAGLDTNILNSFSCKNMRDLSCYGGQGLSFTVNLGCLSDRVVNGCYVFVREPLFGLFGQNGDIKQLSEYIYRFKFYYALCQGVLSNVFNNNWINGNLYAFPFKINTYYNRLNQVRKRVYPNKVVMLQYESNNFYYRSSPYTTQGQFIGSPYSSSPSKGANERNLKYPTTIMNLGPRSAFLEEITLNGSFLGYNVNQLIPTTYNNEEDITNLFAITRMVNPSFLSAIGLSTTSGGQDIRGLFSRPGKKVDADFAQTSAINSQLGVVPVDAGYYTSVAPNENIIVANPGGSNTTMFGIYFQSSEDDLQVRDFVSPVRKIRYNPNTGLFRYDYAPIKSQVVPNYKWYIQPGGQTIFGLETNNWATNIGDIVALKYQSMDRISSGYPYGSTITNDWDYRGYIFGQTLQGIVATSGTLVVGRTYIIDNYVSGDDFTNVGASSNATGISFVATGTNPLVWNGSTLESQAVYQYTGNVQPNPALGGAPWYFYFGLTKGATALNKFFEKYVGQKTLNE